jgi:hypothetical protein
MIQGGEQEGDGRMELQQAYQEYRVAMAAWRAASPTAAREQVDRAAERLIAARVTLYRSLVATGWEPPAAVAVQLDRDIALVDVPEDLEALLLA